MSDKKNALQVLTFDSNKIVVFTEFEKELAILEKENNSLVFDYKDKKGNKEARSHVAKIRKCKKRASDIHQDEKAEALAYGRSLDSVKNALHERIETMIDVHDTPLREIKEKEDDRIQAHENKLQILRNGATLLISGLNSAEIQEYINVINEIKIDESLEEFECEADKLKVYALSILQNGLDRTVAYEAEQAELTKLREEKETREKKEREDKIAQDAAEAAREESETKEKEAKEAEKRAIQQASEAVKQREKAEEKARQDAIVAKEIAKKQEETAAINARNKEILKQENQKKKEAADIAKREADKKNVGKIRKEAKQSLMAAGLDEESAKKIVLAIVHGDIKHVSITY